MAAAAQSAPVKGPTREHVVAHTREMLAAAEKRGVIGSYEELLAEREDENVLRFVTPKVFTENLRHHFQKMTIAPLSDAQLAEIEADVGTSSLPIYLFFGDDNPHELTMHDFYFSGKAVHGDFLREIICSEPLKIQLQGKKSRPTVVSSKTKERVVVEGAYHYIHGNYCYA